MALAARSRAASASNEVAGHEDGRASRSLDGVDDGLALFLVSAAHGDCLPGGGERQRSSFADAARGPRDQGFLVAQFGHC